MTSSFIFSDGHDVMDGHRFRVFALQYNPNHPHIFISGGWDDTVQVTCSFHDI